MAEGALNTIGTSLNVTDDGKFAAFGHSEFLPNLPGVPSRPDGPKCSMRDDTFAWSLNELEENCSLSAIPHEHNNLDPVSRCPFYADAFGFGSEFFDPWPTDGLSPSTGTSGSSRPSHSSGQRCTSCTAICSSILALERHAKQSGHRCFMCPVAGCDRSYGRQDLLARHRKAHSSEEYVCVPCKIEKNQEKSFKRKDHLRQHIKKCHLDCSWPSWQPIPSEASQPGRTKFMKLESTPGCIQEIPYQIDCDQSPPQIIGRESEAGAVEGVVAEIKNNPEFFRKLTGVLTRSLESAHLASLISQQLAV